MTLNNLVLLLTESSPDDGGITAYAREALESMREIWVSIKKDKRYISKRTIIFPLKVILQNVASADKPNNDEIFSYLCALRDGAHLPSSSGSEVDELRKRVSNLFQAVRKKTGKNIAILLIERLYDNTLIGLLKGNKDRMFDYDLCPEFHKSSTELFRKLHKWQRRLIVQVKLLKRIEKLEKKGVNKQKYLKWTRTNEKKLEDDVLEIQRLSRQTWNDLPEFAKEALRPSISNDDFILLSCDDLYADFPFEILQYQEAIGDVGPPKYPFLGLGRVLPRIPAFLDSLERLRDQKVGDGDRTAMVFADPYIPNQEPLERCRLIGEHLQTLLNNAGYRLVPDNVVATGAEATRSNFIEGLKRQPSMVYYNGHGSWNVIERRAHICLSPSSDDGKFFATDLASIGEKGIWFKNNPFFFLNGCKLGQAVSFGTVREDLCGELIRRRAEAVIASPFTLYDYHGVLFTHEFFGNTNVKQNIGERVVRARRAVYSSVNTTDDICWPIWALYALHGNPFARIDYQQDEVRCLAAHRQMGKMLNEMHS
jgi:hypothetical protein